MFPPPGNGRPNDQRFFFKSLAKGLLGVAGTVLPGPLGGAARVGRRLLGNGQQRPTIATTMPVQQRFAPQNGQRGRIVRERGPVFRAGPITIGRRTTVTQFAPDQQPTVTKEQRARQTAAELGLACPQGFRPNKSDYFLSDGTFVEAGSRCVKVRRRNPLNPRAASRAISRIQGAKRAVGLINRISIRKPC